MERATFRQFPPANRTTLVLDFSFHQPMPAGEHALMKNSADENAASIGFIEDDMLPVLDAAKTWMDRIAWPPEIGILSDPSQALNQTI